MKIVEVVTSLDTGGAEKLVVEISNKLSEDTENKIKVISILPIKGIPYHLLKKENIELIQLNSKTLFNPFILLKLFIHTYDCDIIHAHTFYAQLYCAIIGKKSKLITTEHNTYNKRRKSRMLKILDFLMYGKYSKIICISEATQKSLNQWIKNTTHKTVVINNGVDINLYKYAIPYNRNDFGINEEDIVVACVASLTEQKNHKNLIKAMSHTEKNVKLLLLGDGPERLILEALVKKLEMSDRIIFLGVRDDVERILKISDIFILPSKWEGFGLVVVEAVAAGLVTIISDVAGVRDLFSRDSMIFIQPNNILNIASGINEAIRKVNTKYTINTDELEQYSIEKMIESYYQIYKNMKISRGI